MTNDLDELERIGKAATAGEWSWECGSLIGGDYLDDNRQSGVFMEFIANSDWDRKEQDATFICEARNNWQAMIDELRRLKELVRLFGPQEDGPTV